eukprot:TRINITY_DN11567_c0_g1_i1.p1 TRINITY_DN11567_c0_g1~~TRINITY_DN11567_c0_g1_i1.p1  ORF type:complete len:304 (+),score=44.00 TRINITY_DN11567_c0_g1_i1:36-914(+)
MAMRTTAAAAHIMVAKTRKSPPRVAFNHDKSFILVLLVFVLMTTVVMGYQYDPEDHQQQCAAAKPEERHDCGWFGITPLECQERFVYGRYCCFDSTPRGAAPQCYHANDSVFTVPLASRQDCGWPGIERGDCDRRQCSYSHAIEAGSPFLQCFYPRFSPCFVPEDAEDKTRYPCVAQSTENFDEETTDKAKIQALRRSCETLGCCYDPSAKSPKCYLADPKRAKEGMRNWEEEEAWWSYIPVLRSIIGAIPPLTRHRLSLMVYPLLLVLAVVICCLWSSMNSNQALMRAKEI